MTDTFKSALEAYRVDADGPLAERLRFLEGLSAIQAEIAAADLSYEAPGAEIAREALMTGQPIFLSAPPAVPRDDYIAAARRISEYVVSSAGLSDEQASALKEADLAGAITEERLSGVVRSIDTFIAEVTDALAEGAETPVDAAVVAFVLLSALVPFFTGPAAQALAAAGDPDLGGSALATCPVCGSAAALGRVSEATKFKGGDRTLWCSLCHSEWGYERLRCVRCGSRKADSLRYTHVEDDPGHRLHLCEECHGYMRFVFEDDLGKPISMPVEDAVATTLDAIALDMGYAPTVDAAEASD